MPAALVGSVGMPAVELLNKESGQVGQGSEQLRKMHEVLAVQELAFAEPFTYYPHITLAQELRSDELDELVAVARTRWAEFAFDKTFCVEKIAFVQNTRRNDWIDLAECVLGQSDSQVSGERAPLLAE